jgi:hypothetical protein
MAAVEAKTTARHLFRALLRAASYLPDEFARTYIHNHIIHRFRTASKITPARLQDARGDLNVLQRASMGEIKPLTKVMHLSYGRTGRRRRELIVALLRADAKPMQETDPSAAPPVFKEGHTAESPPSPRPVFDTFLQSQSLNHPPDTSRVKIRHLQPQIPKENIWGRPVALKRQRGLRHKWWSETLNKLLPPLPELEWNRLKDLATGVIPFEGPPPRRSTRLSPKRKPREVLELSSLKNPIRHAVRHSLDNRQKTMHQHEINARFMRRIWANVWNLTPKMSYDGESIEWIVTWGGGRSAASNGRVGSVGRADLELFEGVDLLSVGPSRSDYRTRKSGISIPPPAALMASADSVQTQ